MAKQEVLGMMYSVNKFRHYLLGRKFIFHVDHVVLIYLISKQLEAGQLDVVIRGVRVEIQH